MTSQKPPGAFPTFAQPIPPEPPQSPPPVQPTTGPDNPLPPSSPETEPSQSPAPVKSRPGRGTVKTDPAPTPTGISFPGDLPAVIRPVAEPVVEKKDIVRIDAKTAARAGVVLVGILAVAGGMLVKRATRGQATLRKPTTEEAHGIADPLAKIFGRHVRKSERLDDFFDLGAAITAVGEYLDNGDLLVASINPGTMPTFQED